ncbi:Acyl-coenzyme A:6-aminopenicillanic acid acyl-transferase [compost metagenome]
MTVKTMVYKHVVTEGTHYEVGRALGSVFKHDQALREFLSAPFMGADPLLPAAADKAMASFERYCPGLNQEIQGFADELGVQPERIVFYYSYLQPKCYCSQAVLSSGTKDGSSTYHMRTYDYGWEEEPCNQLLLSTTRVTGKAAHTGFALQLFGRYDGMNEEGLSISTTSGRMRPEISGEGFVFPGAVRAVLDVCATTAEAVALLRSLPLADYRNFLVSDRHGSAALIEVAGTCKEVEQLKAPAPGTRQLIASANHYTLPSMQQYNLQLIPSSLARHGLMDTTLSRLPGNEDVLAAMKDLVQRPLPEGVTCHHYSEGFGTLWSLICDNAARKLHVCFGSPQRNAWRTIGFEGPPGISEYTALLPDEPAGADFWSNGS